MDGKLIFTKYENLMLAMLFQKSRMLAAQVLPIERNRIGSIYVGKVKNISANIGACFVEIADGEICFLSRKEAGAPFLLNRRYDGRILEGDELLVQIITEAQKTKQAAVTARVSLPNEYFVLSFDPSAHASFSSKLSVEQKKRILHLLNEKGILEGSRFIPRAELPIPISGVIRTQAGDCSEEELLTAFYRLWTEFADLLKKAPYRTCFSCLHEALPGWAAVLNSLVYPWEYDEIITDQESLWEQISAYCREKQPDKTVRFYQDSTYPLSKLYSVKSRLDEALGKRVWLKSGGYLMIEPTEALTVIDVNSGKYEGRGAKGEKEESSYLLNMEAAAEIALQMRLRNLSGMILVDFVNMLSKDHQEMLLQQMRSLVKSDKQKIMVVDITPLGLMEITRKKNSKPLKEQLKLK